MLDAKPLLIETMRVDKGATIALLPYHVARLKKSAHALGYPFDEKQLRTAIDTCLVSLPEADFSLRLTLSATGTLHLEHNLLVATTEPVSLLLSPTPLRNNPWLQHKTTNRQWFAEATQYIAQHPRIFDVVFFNEHNQLCEGSRSNIYIQHEGLWLTPPIQCGLLGGVKRAQLLATQQVQTAVITKETLLSASAIRVSNALRGWLDANLLLNAD